jgi:hypothetical protein
MEKIEKNILKKTAHILEEYESMFRQSEIRLQYPRYVALYTPIKLNPDIAIIGNNPSWFIGETPTNQKQISEEDRRTDALKGLHNINAYTKWKEPKFHKQFKAFIKEFMKYYNAKETSPDEYINNNVVGWNSQFIQTGASFPNHLNKNKDIKKLKEISTRFTEYLLESLKPKAVIYFGMPSAKASGAYSNTFDLQYLRSLNPHKSNRFTFRHLSRKINKEMKEDAQILSNFLSKQ